MSGAEKRTASNGRLSRKNGARVCCICGRRYAGFGNNADPVKHGRCCDDCNIAIVIPARLARSIFIDEI